MREDDIMRCNLAHLFQIQFHMCHMHTKTQTGAYSYGSIAFSFSISTIMYCLLPVFIINVMHAIIVRCDPSSHLKSKVKVLSAGIVVGGAVTQP